jgi:hypothetical protein
MTVRIIKHESIPQTGSYEVRFADDIGDPAWPETAISSKS